MNRKVSYLMLFIALIATIISVPSNVQAGGKAKNTLRIAMLAPRGSVVDRLFKKLDRDLRKATNNEWGIRIYASGVAGDDKDVVRKMRVGQMDSAILTTTGLSQIVREVTILDCPGFVNDSNDIKKIEKEMWNEWQDTFMKNKVKLVGWFPAGEYRMFSKGPIKSVNDVKSRRVWLLPESFVLKELWRAIGATGVPLGIPDVYAALQTGMVDTFISTAIATVAMQWHAKADHFTTAEAGTLLLTWVINDTTWNKLPKAAKDVISARSAEMNKTAFKDGKKEDMAAVKKLLKRGYTQTGQPSGWKKAEAEVRKRLTGRVFSKALADRILKVTGN